MMQSLNPVTAADDASPPGAQRRVSNRTRRGVDWLNFFLAEIGGRGGI